MRRDCRSRRTFPPTMLHQSCIAGSGTMGHIVSREYSPYRFFFAVSTARDCRDVMKPQASDLEPFIEAPGATSPHADAYRFGYRLDGAVVSAIDLPVETVEKLLLSKTRLSVRITPCGEIVPGIQNAFGELGQTAEIVFSIDDLMRETLTAETLRMEEATPEDLALLFSRLERAIALVRAAIDRVSNYSSNPAFKKP
ncbi:hypothetical protein ACVJH7_007064 [Bradyrhizobium elkanii]